MPDLIQFQFGDKTVRVHIDDHDNLWWEAQDVCAILDIRDISKAVSRLKLGEKKTSESRNVLIINEKGLYRLIMRSNKPEAERFQDWVFHDVLPSIRKTGKYEISRQEPLLHEMSLSEQVASIRTVVDFLQETGMLDERDKLMFADLLRTEVKRQYGQIGESRQKALSTPGGFFLADRLRTLGYTPTRKQEATLMSKGLARAVAQEYRNQHMEEPIRSQRFVDGTVRPVFWYQDENSEWIDPLIQTWCARVGIGSSS